MKIQLEADEFVLLKNELRAVTAMRNAAERQLVLAENALVEKDELIHGYQCIERDNQDYIAWQDRKIKRLKKKLKKVKRK